MENYIHIASIALVLIIGIRVIDNTTKTNKKRKTYRDKLNLIKEN